MSDEKKYTERDLILAKRAAVRLAMLGRTNYSMENIDALTHELFPLPKVVRPRVVTGPGFHRWQWKFDEGGFRFRRDPTYRWEAVHEAWAPSPGLVQLWADLLANPTETCPDE